MEYHHSKWPTFLRMKGSVLPKMIIPLTFVGAWATAITCIDRLVQTIAIESVLLTVTGFVVGLALSFRSSTAYERYSEGRKYWAQLLFTSRNLARLIWVHVQERHEESAETGKSDVLGKLAALNLLNAFAVALKHRLRFEPSTEYPDLAPLLCNVRTLAGDADQAALRERKVSSWKSAGQHLGVSFAESNPRKILKKSKDNLGNTPMEVLTYLSAYFENCYTNKTVTVGTHQVQATNMLASLTDVLSGCERVVNTPLPVAYSISISQITWAYVLVLPFQLVGYLQWVTIPGTILAGYIILGLAQIGRELENPFGLDVNDLPLDAFCQELANEIDTLTSQPAPLDNQQWMRDGGAKVLWPFSEMEYKGWEDRSLDEIRAALKLKAGSRDVKIQRAQTLVVSNDQSNEQ
jgi:ion channel-forming bestrophin family protein